MKVIKPQTLSVLTRPFEWRRQFRLGVSVIAFMPTGAPSLLKEQVMWPFLAEELPPEQALDAAIPKARAEFVATAIAHAPGGAPVRSLRAGIQLGPVTKTLHVTGDRYILGDRASEPAPFTTLPIDWAHAYGGPGVAENPGGRGSQPVDTPAGRLVPVPNVLHGRPAGEYRQPAGFGPLDQTWPERARRVGTHDDAWLKNDFPGFARDIDWRFFNVAPPDQQLDALAGDEAYAFENLHPGRPLLQGRLPGLHARFFLQRRGGQGLEEVPLRLTTVWFFPHRERLALVYHGQAAVAEEDASDIGRIMAAADRAGATRPTSHYEAVFARRCDPETSGDEALRDGDLVPAEWLAADAPSPFEAGILHAVDLPRRRTHRRRRQMILQAREDLEARGLDPDAFGVLPVPPPEPEPAPNLEQAATMASAAREEAARSAAAAREELQAREDANEAAMASIGMDLAAIRAARKDGPRGPPTFDATAQLAGMAQQHQALAALGPVPADVPDPADPATADRIGQAQAGLRAAYQRTAHGQAPARAASAERSAAMRAILARDPAAARAAYDLSGVDLSGLDLSGADLSGVCLDGANLAGASLAGATLAGAVLAHARMDGCRLDGADLASANLGGARLLRASLRGAGLAGAVLNKADLRGADLRDANLEGADLGGAALDGASLDSARAPGVLMLDLSLAGLQAPGAALDGAQFIRCDLSGADLSAASLAGALFLGCTLDGARLDGAALRGAVFVDGCSLAHASLAGASLAGANLRGVAAPGAQLDRAVLEGADLSGADLSDASLAAVNARDARLTAAVLCRAKLRGANLMRADLARADLRGTDLSGACLLEANLSRVHLDTTTQSAGSMTTRMRHLPRRHAPQNTPRNAAGEAT